MLFGDAFVKIMILFFFVFSYTTPFTFPSLVYGQEPEEEIASLQRVFEDAKDITGNFTQTSTIKDLKRTDTYRGRFYIKGDKFRWEYTGEKPQIVYLSGDTFIIYLKNEKQAFISRVDSSPYRQSPLILLRGLKDIRNDFNISRRDNKLIFRPKKPIENVSQIEVTLSQEEFPIKSLKIIDSAGNSTQLVLRDIKINTGVKDSIFEFTPPEGVSLIRQ